MGQQTLTQTITILIGENTLADTGLNFSLFIALALTLLTLSLTVYLFLSRRTPKLCFQGFRNLSTFIFLTFTITSLTFSLPTASAAPTLTLAANQQNLNITVPKGGGVATAQTIITTNTLNDTGYTLTASLETAELGIGMELKGGDITADTALTAGEVPLTLKTTTEANSEDPESSSATDTIEVALTFTVGDTVTEGTKQLKLVYRAVDNEPATAPLATMQSFTQSQCSALPVYDGSNPSAILTLTDNRGATPADYQTYEVAKLVDGNCWMLENLKLGSTTSSITLTPQDTDITTNFILPQVAATGDSSYDDPGAYGPIPGDTGEGATNYGYLYNWSAATAGESRASHDETAGDAPYSICATGWRLPSRGADDQWNVANPNNEFSVLSAKMAGFTNNQDQAYIDNYHNYYQAWQYDGPLKGAFAGWWGSFDGQGDWGGLWSSSASPGWADGALSAAFSADEVAPGGGNDRNDGFGVRCLLN